MVEFLDYAQARKHSNIEFREYGSGPRPPEGCRGSGVCVSGAGERVNSAADTGIFAINTRAFKGLVGPIAGTTPSQYHGSVCGQPYRARDKEATREGWEHCS